jgi:hypothetical protein
MQKINRFPSYSNMYGQVNFGLSDKNVFSYFGPATSPDSAIYDNVKNFFQRGLSQTHNISLEYGKKKTSWRFSGSAFMQDGVVPNNTFNRYNLRLSNTTKIGKYIDVSPAISYINSNNQKPLRGAGGYLLNLMLWPMDNNITNFVDSNAIKIKMGNNEFDNPLFSANNNRSYDKTDRVLTTLGININPTSWLTISGRFGYDYYRSTGYTIIDSLSSLA